MLDFHYSILFSFLVSSACLVYGEKPPEKIVVNQGLDVSMYCSSNNPFGFCEWKMESKGTTCNIAMDNTNSGTCKNAPRVRWQTNNTHCGITITKVSRLEADKYYCKLFTSENTYDNRGYDLEVASWAKVSLLQEGFPLSSDEDLTVDAKSTVDFECEASFGFPPPVVTAFIGKLDSSSGENISPSKTKTEKNSDGTFTTRGTYSLMAKPEHCGLYLKCVSSQPGSNSVDVFAQNGPNVEAIKIEVNYPPQPLTNPPLPFKFTSGSEKLIISIDFMSSPQPQDNQAVWYIGQSGDTGMPYLPIQAGGKQSRYSAQTLTSTGHHTTAVLEISKPSNVDVGSNNYLAITTNLGDQKYYFGIEKDNHVEDYNPEHQPEEEEEEIDEDEGNRTLKTTIVVSVILVIVVAIVAVVVVVWLKRQGKLCFAKQPEPRKNPEENRTSLLNQNVKENGTDQSV